MLGVFCLGGILAEKINKIPLTAPLIRKVKSTSFGHYTPEVPTREILICHPSPGFQVGELLCYCGTKAWRKTTARCTPGWQYFETTSWVVFRGLWCWTCISHTAENAKPLFQIINCISMLKEGKRLVRLSVVICFPATLEFIWDGCYLTYSQCLVDETKAVHNNPLSSLLAWMKIRSVSQIWCKSLYDQGEYRIQFIGYLSNWMYFTLCCSSFLLPV